MAIHRTQFCLLEKGSRSAPRLATGLGLGDTVELATRGFQSARHRNARRDRDALKSRGLESMTFHEAGGPADLTD